MHVQSLHSFKQLSWFLIAPISSLDVCYPRIGFSLIIAFASFSYTANLIIASAPRSAQIARRGGLLIEYVYESKVSKL